MEAHNFLSFTTELQQKATVITDKILQKQPFTQLIIADGVVTVMDMLYRNGFKFQIPG